MSPFRRRTSTVFLVRPLPTDADAADPRARHDSGNSVDGRSGMAAAKVEELTRSVEERRALLARIDDLRAEQRELYAKCIKAEKAERVVRRKDDIRAPAPSEPVGSSAEARKGQGNPARSARHLLSVIRDVLDLAKLESGQATLEKTDTPARAAVVEACDVVANQATRKRVVLELDAASDRSVEADPVRLTRVISNLVANAVARAPEASAVRVRTVDDGGSVLFSVDYEGSPGFTLASRSSDGREEGADMELALEISRKILALHGADLVFAERDRGTFSFRLPVGGQDSPRPAPVESGRLPRR
jgi:signal transduction histidine kinase